MAGYKNFGAETLLAADVNNYLMRQSVIRVASEAELAEITAPEPGMMAYRQDTAATYRHDGTTWQVFAAPPIDYTPVNSNLSVGNGTQTAFYAITNGIVHVSYRLQFGSTTAITGTLNIGLPVPAVAGAHGLGVGYAVDASASGSASRTGLFVASNFNGTQALFRPDGGDLVQSTAPFASWGTGDTIGFEIDYRPA